MLLIKITIKLRQVIESERTERCEVPWMKPVSLERSRSRGASGSSPERTLWGNLEMNSHFNEVTEFCNNGAFISPIFTSIHSKTEQTLQSFKMNMLMSLLRKKNPEEMHALLYIYICMHGTENLRPRCHDDYFFVFYTFLMINMFFVIRILYIFND